MCTSDLFKPFEKCSCNKRVKSGDYTELSYEYLLSMRSKAASSLKQSTKNVEFSIKYRDRFRSPVWKLDKSDPLFKFWNRADKLHISHPSLKHNGGGLEFADRTLISPQTLNNLESRSKDIKRKRERLKRKNRRVVDSFVGKGGRAAAVRNIGNNLAEPNKVSKPVRDRRYKIQRYIQRFGLSNSQYVCNCGCNISKVVHVKKNKEFGNVNFGGVATCGSVWACPVCRAKIINEREKQLKKIYSSGIDKGYHFSFLTLTFSHSEHDNLARMHGNSNDKTGLSGAITVLRQSAAWSKHMKKELGYIGDIRAVEVTWGASNGFHPHVHFVIISKNKPDVEKWENKIYRQWAKCCDKTGLGMPNRKHGVKYEYVVDAAQVAYLAKWAAPNELVSADAKKAEKGMDSGLHYTMAELERSLIDPVYASIYNVDRNVSVNVLKAYYAGMSGQKMLTYGNTASGWKDDLLGVDPDDKELTAEEYQEKFESHICYIDSEVYKKAKKMGFLNTIVEALEAIPAGPMLKIKAAARLKQLLKSKGVDYQGKVYSRFSEPWNNYAKLSFD